MSEKPLHSIGSARESTLPSPQKTPDSANVELISDRRAMLLNWYKMNGAHFTATTCNRLVHQLKLHMEGKDLAQTAYLKAMRIIDQYDPAAGNFDQWLVTIARTQAIDAQRLNKNKGLPPDSDTYDFVGIADHIADDAPSPETLLNQKRAVEKARQLLADLPADEQAVVRAHHLKGDTNSQISADTGIPEGTVKGRIDRGMKKIKKKYVEKGL